ncbi:hypothetical protein NK8_72680 (plasmid) [Caballeronia sp. NK8]|nr:hypothetical protein NK8_72680 [Caballeronia sp. NK8]
MAAPYATDLPNDGSAPRVAAGVCALPIPGHTRGGVLYLLEDRVLFSGDSLAWTPREQELFAFREACWHSWAEFATSLGTFWINVHWSSVQH